MNVLDTYLHENTYVCECVCVQYTDASYTIPSPYTVRSNKIFREFNIQIFRASDRGTNEFQVGLLSDTPYYCSTGSMWLGWDDVTKQTINMHRRHCKKGKI